MTKWIAALAAVSLAAAPAAAQASRAAAPVEDAETLTGGATIAWIMAAIMVMDELTELQKRIKGMESEIGTLRKTRDDALLKADKNDTALTGALTGLAQRMETLAERLAVKKASQPAPQAGQ